MLNKLLNRKLKFKSQIPYAPIRMTKIRITKPSIGNEAEKLALWYTNGRTVKWYHHIEHSLVIFHKFKQTFTI